MRPLYPWSAVVGQDALKHALLLAAIDPALGGVLLEGPRGVAKTTLARALGELVSGRFVELPLGASEERVTGTLDLGAALRDGAVSFSPGLLSRAHEGVLYVDEVNLLPDALVDLLLDAAASGQNVVERDGVSHAHPARFVLIGTMNPEEGELRPQLTDRFGLSVRAEGTIQPAERAEILRRRLAFDLDPAAFVARYEGEQRALRERCARARARMATIPLAGDALELVTERCHAAGVEGLRADLAMLRAARAHAALREGERITEEDIEAVAELALAHRRRPGSEPPRSPPRSGPSGGSGAPSPSGGSGSGPRSSSGSAAGPREDPRERERGALAAIPVRPAPAPALPRALTEASGARAESRRRGRARVRTSQRGRREASAREGRTIDWFATLSRARRPRLEDVRYRLRRAPFAQLWVLALDCSSSMLRGGALSAAKGVAQALEREARRAGAHVALISFRGDAARLELTPGTRSGAREQALSGLLGGGGTPLGQALDEAHALCASRPFRPPSVTKRIFLLTDGRTREQVGPAGRDVAYVVIDCERSQVRLGRARGLAHGLAGSYLHVDALALTPP